METVKDEIQRATQVLKLSGDTFTEVSARESATVIERAVKTFVNGRPRWWWEAFKTPCASWQSPDDIGFRHLTKIVPPSSGHLFFVAEERLLSSYPVYEGTLDAIVRVIGECYGFEYYIFSKNFEWIVCENHHGVIIGAGLPVTKTLEHLES